jgi:L-threonylcarbamoyladenylate synthase
MTGSNEQMGIVEKAAAHLRAGGLVAVPTETVYGLAADASNAEAVAQIYRTKGRPDFNPLIVHVPGLNAAQQLGQFNPLALKLAEMFWPGPMTLVLPKTEQCSVTEAVTAGLDTIAIRNPKHPIMRELLDASNLNLAAPSANKSGGISPTTAEHVRESLGSDQPIILDGGPCEQGLESTIVAVREGGYQILRPGPVTEEMLIEASGLKPAAIANQKIEAPGQLASHYAPSKPVRLNVEQAKTDEFYIGFGSIAGHVNLSQSGDLAETAANLFAALHLADAADQAKIAIAAIPETGMGQAINDRLRRAAVQS